MPLKTELMAGGMPAALASRLGYDAPSVGLTATGSTQATALTMVSNFSNFTTVGSSTGAIISARQGTVINNGVSALTLYPPVGGNINGGTVNAGISIPAGKSALYSDAGTTYVVNVSA